MSCLENREGKTLMLNTVEREGRYNPDVLRQLATLLNILNILNIPPYIILTISPIEKETVVNLMSRVSSQPPPEK